MTTFFKAIELKEISLRILLPASCIDLKDKSGLDKVIVKKQPYQLVNTSREFFPHFYISNFHKLADQFS